MRRFAGERALAWVDDELGHDAHAWATAREAPTLLIDVRADRGLSAQDVDELLAFARARASSCGG